MALKERRGPEMFKSDHDIDTTHLGRMCVVRSEVIALSGG
jgi:hypothetical protein